LLPQGSPTNTISYPNSTKLPRRNESIRASATANTAKNDSSSDTTEIDFKDILDQMCESISSTHLSEWFKFNQRQQEDTSSQGTRPDSPSSSVFDSSSSPPMHHRRHRSSTSSLHLFDSIHQALNYIDFNLKRNSDFINELTKLLDTSRAIKQEAQLKKGVQFLCIISIFIPSISTNCS
jgi:hypothetical protein